MGLMGEAIPSMAVLRPLKLVLTNWPEDKRDELPLENHPDHPEWGTHLSVMTRELYIEQEDFMEVPAKKYFRLFLGGEVRLKGAYIIRADRCDKDENGNVTCVYCTVDMDTRNGSEGANRKVKGTLHWVSATECLPMEARLYEPLLVEEGDQADEAVADEKPEEEAAAPSSALKKDFLKRLNPNSLVTCRGFMEKSLADAKTGNKYQFLRMGYFCKDPDSTAEKAVFNLVVGLKDSFKKEVKA